jgi:Holliday junction resolvasome RuvABC endonuclease subunit
MNILGIDLGTKTGLAYNYDSDFRCGTVTLGTPKEIREWGKTRLTRRCDPRVERLFSHLQGIKNGVKFDAVIFEDVQFASSTYQVQLWAALRAAVWLAFPGTLIECVSVGTLKKYATGHGGADKEMMAAALYRESPASKALNLGDDAIDAIWLWRWGKHNLGRIVKA